MWKTLTALWHENQGSVAIEYGLIATLLSIIAIGSMLMIGGSVYDFFTDASAGFTR